MSLLLKNLLFAKKFNRTTIRFVAAILLFASIYIQCGLTESSMLMNAQEHKQMMADNLGDCRMTCVQTEKFSHEEFAYIHYTPLTPDASHVRVAHNIDERKDISRNFNKHSSTPYLAYTPRGTYADGIILRV